MRNQDGTSPQVLAGLRFPPLYLLLLPGCGPVQREALLPSRCRLAGLHRPVRPGHPLAGPPRLGRSPPSRRSRAPAPPPGSGLPPRFAEDASERSRTPESHPPQPEELLRLIVGRLSGMSLRELCVALWPSLRWKPLFPDEDSASERVREGGKTAAELVHAQMMALYHRGSVSLSLSPHEKIEAQAAIVYSARHRGGGLHV